MDNEIMEFEAESEAPAEWRENVILVRDGRCRMVEIDVPDDAEEVAEDA